MSVGRHLTLVQAGGLPAIAVLGSDRPFLWCRAGSSHRSARIPSMRPPVEEKLRAVGIRVFHRIRIEILVHVGDAFGTQLVMAAAQRLGLDRPLVFHPSEMIDDVDIKVVEAAAAGPDEAVEALHLVEQVADAGRFGKRGEISAGPMHPVTPLENDLADLAVMDALGQFLERPAVTRHQSHADLEVLGGGVLREA